MRPITDRPYGETIKKLLEEQVWGDWFIDHCNISREDSKKILNSSTSLTHEIADKLEFATDIEASFWRRLQWSDDGITIYDAGVGQFLHPDACDYYKTKWDRFLGFFGILSKAEKARLERKQESFRIKPDFAKRLLNARNKSKQSNIEDNK